MTTFVTGGTSALGRVLVRELVRQGDAVRILVPPESRRDGLELPGVTFVRGDITDPVTVRKGMTGCTRVCHLSALGKLFPDPAAGRDAPDGTTQIMQAALDLRVDSVVQVSTVVALGPTAPGEPPAEEDHWTRAPRAFAAYQQSQRAADAIALQYADKGLPVSLVYAGFGYGYAQGAAPSLLTEQTLLRMAAQRGPRKGPAQALIPGNGRTRLAATSYLDLAQGIILAAERGRPGEGYILAGENVTLPAMWSAVAEVLGRQLQRRRAPLWWVRLTSSLARLATGHAAFPPDFLALLRHDWSYSSEKAQAELGWTPQRFGAGIAQAWHEIQARPRPTRAPARPTVRVLPRS